MICRDRASGYAEDATNGAPDALQVADRWHLMHHLSEAVRKVVTAHRRCLRAAAETASRHRSTEDSPEPRAAASAG